MSRQPRATAFGKDGKNPKQSASIVDSILFWKRCLSLGPYFLMLDNLNSLLLNSEIKLHCPWLTHSKSDRSPGIQKPKPTRIGICYLICM